MTTPARLLLGVTGSIAAYKAVELLRLLTQDGWDVSVILTEAAAEFVGPLTFQTLSRNPVGQGGGDVAGWKPEHIALADEASLAVVAPCTANLLAKMAHGLADDLLSSALLATRATVIVAPAMNGKMWTHPATQANVRLLRERGVVFVDPVEGELACGYAGHGKMAEPQAVREAVQAWRARTTGGSVE